MAAFNDEGGSTGSAGSGVRTDATRADQHEDSHDQVYRRPRHPVREDQRAGSGQEHGDAVAEDVHSGAGTHFTFLEDISPVGVDRDVLSGAEERDGDRDEGHTGDRIRWVAQ